jgi:hypothetical protein
LSFKAQNDHNAMSQERRVLSLMRWIQMLRQDIEIQRRSKDGLLDIFVSFFARKKPFSLPIYSGYFLSVKIS